MVDIRSPGPDLSEAGWRAVSGKGSVAVAPVAARTEKGAADTHLVGLVREAEEGYTG